MVNLDAVASFFYDRVMTEPDSNTIAAWTSLASVSRAMLERIERALRQGGFPALGWYDALLEIEKAGPGGIRPFELKDRLLLPQYGTSRLLERIARAGLIERTGCKGDGRGQVVRITDQGRAIRCAMWPVYAEVLSEAFETRLSPAETTELARLLRKIGREG